jgi:GTP-binding protein
LDDIDKIDMELERYSATLSERPQILVANKIDSVLEDDPILDEFRAYAEKLGRPVLFVSTVTGEGLDTLVKTCSEMLETLPELTVYDTELSAEDSVVADAMETTVRVDEGVYYVEGKWLLNFMGQINFDDYESLNFFQRVLIKNGVIDKLRAAGIEEGDTVNIYDFEFDFVY